MNISAVRTMMPQRTSFKGQEVEQPKSDSQTIAEAINKNTEALNTLSSKADIIAYTLYAIEKSKSGTNGLHQNAYSKTTNPVEFINYVNRNWEKPRY